MTDYWCTEEEEREREEIRADCEKNGGMQRGEKEREK